MDEQFVLCELENEFFCKGLKINRIYRFITVVFIYLHFPAAHWFTTVQWRQCF